MAWQLTSQLSNGRERDEIRHRLHEFHHRWIEVEEIHADLQAKMNPWMKEVKHWLNEDQHDESSIAKGQQLLTKSSKYLHSMQRVKHRFHRDLVHALPLFSFRDSPSFDLVRSMDGRIHSDKEGIATEDQ